MFKYKKIGLGGTFDHFHRGHQAFLLFASQLGEHLVIGITTPEMIAHKKFSTQIETYETRAAAVASFTKNFINKVDVFPLTDPYGPTLRGSNVEALAATSATKSGAEAINNKRLTYGLGELPIHVCELENDENGLPLSSERIRSGVVSRTGTVYENVFSDTLTITTDQKGAFTDPQGPLVKHPSPSDITIVVGDTTLETFINNNWPYHLGVVDFMKARKPYSPHVIDDPTAFIAPNQPGTISHDIVTQLKHALTENTQHLIVEGEEDLAAVALVLLAPLGTHIYYGQPNQGIVEMIVTEEKKNYCYSILSHS